MHWTLIVTSLLVAWSMGAGLWRPGSFVLAVAWMIAQAHYVITGDAVPLELYWCLDALVIGAVLNWRASWLDWIILMAFPIEWWAYDFLEGATQWWALWGLAGAQLLAAGPWPGIQRSKGGYSHGPLPGKAVRYGG